MYIKQCTGCDATVEYQTIDPMNVGEVVRLTGWHYSACGWSQKSVWLCPKCAKEAKDLAARLQQIVKTPYYYWTALVSKETRDKWEAEN